jgi:hypothetical protein
VLGQSGTGEFALGQIEAGAVVVSVPGFVKVVVGRVGRPIVDIDHLWLTDFGPAMQALTDVTILDSAKMTVEIS